MNFKKMAFLGMLVLFITFLSSGCGKDDGSAKSGASTFTLKGSGS